MLSYNFTFKLQVTLQCKKINTSFRLNIINIPTKISIKPLYKEKKPCLHSIHYTCTLHDGNDAQFLIINTTAYMYGCV